MREPNDIIALADYARRRLAAPAPAATPVSGEASPARLGVAVLAGVFLLCLGGGLVGAFAHPLARRSLEGLPAARRAEILARARRDVEDTCALPEARNGALLEHCRAQASFVLLFPECDAACSRSARALLPHARR